MYPSPSNQLSTPLFSMGPDLKKFIIKQNSLLEQIVNSNAERIFQLQKVLNALLNEPNSEVNENALNLNRFDMSPLWSTSFVGKLKLTKELPNIICKSKYFKMSVEIDTESGNPLLEKERINLSVSLYTSGPAPQKILSTMKGKDIFRGNTERILAFDPIESKHMAHFKIQICEVSSHFVGGIVTLKIEANHDSLHNGFCVKPLVVDNLQIRAKHIRAIPN